MNEDLPPGPEQRTKRFTPYMSTGSRFRVVECGPLDKTARRTWTVPG
jgi:hypothetical protein